jgi:hypothetical protein
VTTTAMATHGAGTVLTLSSLFKGRTRVSCPETDCLSSYAFIDTDHTGTEGREAVTRRRKYLYLCHCAGKHEI